MQNRKKSSKSLIVGIVAAVIVLAVLLVLLLTQCSPADSNAPTETTVPATEGTPTYELYWNMDLKEYAGKSEAGMSSRMPESDGLFSIRYMLDGQEVVLRTADRRLVNKIDAMEMMGLVFDEDGLIVDVIDPEDMPLELPGFRFYVQSVGGNVIKLNSSDTFVGMEVLLEANENTGIWDMTGVSGPIGVETKLVSMDRVICVQNLAGELTHVFVVDRSNYFLTHEAECEHCKEVVTWIEWTKTDVLPKKSGHYQLQNDIAVKSQLSMPTDTKLCLDLNGYRVDGHKDGRIISLHNAGCELALMDTSEEKTGVMAGHSTASPQGGVVWVRYGAFYMYGGTLDGSDMTSRLNGTVVEVRKNAFFYMHGGEIIGGTAAAQPLETSTTGWGYGLGGSVSVSGTMRMYDGIIRDGKAPGAYYYNDKGKLAVTRGLGGNIFLGSGAVLEMKGGKILNGFAGNVGGNLYMDGTAELILSGGTISGGWSYSTVADRHGGGIYVGGKATIEMSGGVIAGGYNANAAGGNMYLGGKLNMYGGSIYGGRAKTAGGNIHTASNGKLNMYGGSISGGVSEGTAGNVNVSGSATLNLYGGSISGGVAATSGGNVNVNVKGKLNMYGGQITGGTANGKEAGNGGGNISVLHNNAVVNISGGTVSGGTSNGTVNDDGTTLGGDGGNINMNRGTMTVTGGTVTGGKATGNAGGIYVGWNTLTMTLGGTAKIYGNEGADIVRSANTAKGKSQIIVDGWQGNGDKGLLVIDRLNGTAGSLLATATEGKVLNAEDLAKFTGKRKILPVCLSDEGTLILSPVAVMGEGDHFHCVCGGTLKGTAGHTCTDVGYVSVNAAEFSECWASGSDSASLLGSMNLRLTEDITITKEFVTAGGVLNLDLNGHTVTMKDKGRLNANGTTGVLNITDCVGTGKIVAAEGCRYSILFAYKGSINMYGGTVDASAVKESMEAKDDKNGGAVTVYNEGDVFTMYGGTIIGGEIYRGGALYAYKGGIVIRGGTVTGGKATIGGNVAANFGTFEMSGGAIYGGNATTNGAGLAMGYNCKTALAISGDARIYGNTGCEDVYLGQKPANKVNYLILDNWNGNGDNNGDGNVDTLVVTGNGVGAGSILAMAKEGDLTADTLPMLEYAGKELKLELSAGKVILSVVGDHFHCVCGGALEGTDGHTCEDVDYVSVNAEKFMTYWTLSDGKYLLKGGMNLRLTEDITLDKEFATDGGVLNLDLSGHTITMKDNGRITVNGTTGVLNITDCSEHESGKIVAAEGCRYSILFAYKGSINMYGGTVDASAVKESMEAKDDKNGGAVTVYNEGDVFTMYGGTVIGGEIYRGGALYAYKGGIVIRGGTVTGGKATIGGNVAVNFGTFEMSGGAIYGGNATTNGAGLAIGYNSKTAPVISGDAKIYGNTGCEDVYLGQKPANKVNYLILDNWNGNGDNDSDGNVDALVVTGNGVSIGSTLAMAKEGALTDDVLSLIKYPSDAMELVISEGKAVLAAVSKHEHCICNGELENTDGHTCAKLNFVEVETAAEFDALFDASNYLTGDVNMVLTGDFTLDAEYWNNGYNWNLCLNGHTITMTGKARLTTNKETGILNITDCSESETGKIAAATIPADPEAGTEEIKCQNGFVYTNKGKLNLYAGTIDGSAIKESLTDTTKDGGAVYVNASGDLFTMYGGTVIGGEIYRGGAVYAYKGGIVIRGGTVTGGKAGIGGNVAVNFGTFEMSGGAIYGGNATTNGAGLAIGYNSKTAPVISGDAKIYGNTGCEDVYLGQKKTLKINYLILDGWNGNGNGTGAMTVSQISDCQTTIIAKPAEGKTLTEADRTKLASFGTGLQVILKDGNLELADGHSHCICNGKLSGTEGHTCNTLIFTEVTAAQFLSDTYWTAASGGGYDLKQSVNLCLTGDEAVVLAAEYRLGENMVLNLCLNGKTISVTTGRFTADKVGSQLNITDCASGGTIAVASKDGNYAPVNVRNGAAALYSGTIDASKLETTSNGGAVYVNTANANFAMYGGEIKGAAKAVKGAAVYIANGSFVLHDGTITGGTATSGGAIHIGSANGSFTMYNGTVKNGNATTDGGNLYQERGNVSLLGGTVTGGNATGNGDGIYMAWNAAQLKISGNALVYGNGEADVCRSDNGNATVNYIDLDGWNGNGTNGKLKLARATGNEGEAVIADDDHHPTEATLALVESADPDYTLKLADNKIVLQQRHKHCLCNGKVTGHSCTPIYFTEVTAAQFLSDTYWTAASDGGYDLKESVNLCLTEAVTLEAQYRMNGKTLNLCLNGQTVTVAASGRLTANGAGNLNITDCAQANTDGLPKGTILTNAKFQLQANGGHIALYNGHVNASAVNITGTSDSNAGGAVRVETDASTFTMYGGRITGATLVPRGAGVYVQKGNFTMHGGIITGGTATTYGGGVGVNYGTMNMTGGIITGCHTKDSANGGGGVNIGYNATEFVLSGDAKIYGNFLNSAPDDVRIGNSKKNAGLKYYLVLDQWQGNGVDENDNARVLYLTHSAAKANTVVAQGKTGELTAEDMAKFACTNTGFKFAIADGKMVLTAE